MKQLVLASLTALAVTQAAGCIITSGDDTGEDATISATWQLRSEATNSTATCPPNFDTAALYNQPVDANGNPVGSPIIDLFDCAAGSGVSAPLPPTLYQTWVEITTHNNAGAPYAKSLSAFVDVTDSDKTFNTQILVDGGYFQFDWALLGANTNRDLSCAEAGATGGVEAVGTEVSTPSNSASDIFDCEDRTGITAGYTAGTYTVSIAALNSSNQSIGTAATLTNKRIEMPNKVTDLGLIMIPIDGL